MSTVTLSVSSASEQNLAARQPDELLAVGEASWELTPDRWVQQQLLRLTLASVLEARLLNVRAGRLAAFNLSADPEIVTLTQLAALHREHHGTAGQAFELAVADACNAGVPQVTQPLLEALQLLGVSPDAPPRMQVLGLEKIPALYAAEIADQLRTQLPADGMLRTGTPGRPANVDTVLARLTQTNWRSVPKPNGYEPQVSQQPRADAMLVSGLAMALVSIKLRETAVFRPGWAGVPIWITLDPGSPTQVYRRNEARCPTVVVKLGQGAWSTAFYEALNLLDVVARDVDLGHSTPRRGGRPWGNPIAAPIAFQLGKLRDEPIGAVAHELRRVHPAVLEQAEVDAAVGRSVLEIPILDAVGLHRGWQNESDHGALFAGQRHLFMPAEGNGRKRFERHYIH